MGIMEMIWEAQNRDLLNTKYLELRPSEMRKNAKCRSQVSQCHTAPSVAVRLDSVTLRQA
jgi:hypothetical protein